MGLQSHFDTARLELFPLNTSHGEFIFALVNSEDWIRFIGDRKVRTSGDADAYIEKIISNKHFMYWVVALKEDHQPMGIITYIKRDYLDFPDIGFAFLPTHTKLGYAFEAASVVLQSLLTQCSVDYILATTVPDNAGSIRLLRKLGFSLRNEIEVENEILQVYSLPLQ